MYYFLTFSNIPIFVFYTSFNELQWNNSWYWICINRNINTHNYILIHFFYLCTHINLLLFQYIECDIHVNWDFTTILKYKFFHSLLRQLSFKYKSTSTTLVYHFSAKNILKYFQSIKYPYSLLSSENYILEWRHSTKNQFSSAVLLL